jgi:hypothetical protein
VVTRKKKGWARPMPAPSMNPGRVPADLVGLFPRVPDALSRL